MCLDRVFHGKEKKGALAELPRRFIVWKVADRTLSGYGPVWKHRQEVYRAGRRRAGHRGLIWTFSGMDSYRCGFHAWRKREVARSHAKDSGGSCVVMMCKARKEDIVAIGMQHGDGVVILSHLIFPKKCGTPKKGGQ